MIQALPRKIVVVGVSCSGKSTLAQALSKALAIPHIELDALHWLPGWKEVDTETFRNKVQKALQGQSWIADGNYSKAQDLVWPEADLIVWIDLPLRVILLRFLKRSLKRSYSGEVLWGTCKETLRNTLWKRDSLLMWILKTHRTHKARYLKAMQEPKYPNLSFQRVQSSKDISKLLKDLTGLNAQRSS